MNDLNIGLLPTTHAVNAALLARLAANLDLTQTQYERARSAYEAVSQVLAADDRPALKHSRIVPHGSFALGTVIRPVNEEDEFDVDLICRLQETASLEPAQAKQLVGSCLKADARYATKTEEKRRCWQIKYAGEFHLDVAPVVPATNSGDWIPDRDLKRWMPTNPEGYAQWFNALADAARTERLEETRVIKADIEPFPVDPADRGWLRRLIQLLKRHRDIWKNSLPPTHIDFAPISIVITTLAGYTFARIRGEMRLSNPFELLQAIVKEMPAEMMRLKQKDESGREVWSLPNPSHPSENFANRWNEAAEWVEAFFSWCTALEGMFDTLEKSEGIDESIGELQKSFGERVANAAGRDYGDYIRKARETGNLKLTKAGLAASAAVAGTPVRQHTFYGD